MLNISEKAKQGLPLNDIEIIDAHNHMGHFREFNIPQNSAEGMLESMDSLGIDKCMVTHHAAAIGPDFKFGNDQVIEAVKRYPDRFMGYVTINPHYPEEIVEELDRCFSVEGMKAIKVHPEYHQCSIDDSNYQDVYEYADANKLPVLSHVWGLSQVEIINNLAKKYPNAIFIMGHGGAKAKAMEYAIEVMKKRENTVIDIAISASPQGNIEWLVDQIGSKRLLFGSDMPFYDPSFTFGRLALADISDEEKKDIFARNIKRIIK